MRIGFIAGEYPPMQGGVGAYTRLLAETLAAGGETICVLSTQSARTDHPTLRLDNHLRHWHWRCTRDVQAWAQREQLDLVSLQYQTAAFNMSPWIHFLPDALHPIPTVTTFHDLRTPYLFPKAGPLRTWIVMRLAQRSKGVIATNHEDFAHLSKHPHPILIPIGSNILPELPPDYDPREWRAKVGAKPDDFLIAYFGLINRSKGVDVAVRALAQMREVGIPARLVIIGGTIGENDPDNAAYAEEIDALVQSLDVGKYIYRTGYIEDLSVGAYLHAADAAALPYHDGASYRRGSLMAALRCGCAIVTTHPVVAIPSFTKGEPMLLAPPGDALAVAQQLGRIHKDDTLKARLRTSAAHLAQSFDWGQIAQAHVTCFRRLLEIEG
jgi:glycosyltransferase involved in cell wall biosynthesis